MGRRDRLISSSILRAIFRTGSKQDDDDAEARPGLLARIIAFFAIFSLSLSRYRGRLFKKLRNETWQIEEEEYTESFRSPSKNKRTDLVAIGDLGYSGSVCSVYQHKQSYTDRRRPSSRLPIPNTLSSRCLEYSSRTSSAIASSVPMWSTWSSTRTLC
jgi:hypothetical protein